MAKSLSPEAVESLVRNRMACALCGDPFGSVCEGATRVFVRFRRGNPRIPLEWGSVCLACADPYLRRGLLPTLADCPAVQSLVEAVRVQLKQAAGELLSGKGREATSA